MSNTTIRIEALSSAIQSELNLYAKDVQDKVDAATEETMKKVVSQSKQNAPVGSRGKFKRSITYKLLRSKATGKTYVWYVKGKNARLAHLLVHGHALENGGHTRANSFLQDAIDDAYPDYENALRRLLNND